MYSWLFLPGLVHVSRLYLRYSVCCTRVSHVDVGQTKKTQNLTSKMLFIHDRMKARQVEILHILTTIWQLQ